MISLCPSWDWRTEWAGPGGWARAAPPECLVPKEALGCIIGQTPDGHHAPMRLVQDLDGRLAHMAQVVLQPDDSVRFFCNDSVPGFRDNRGLARIVWQVIKDFEVPSKNRLGGPMTLTGPEWGGVIPIESLQNSGFYDLGNTVEEWDLIVEELETSDQISKTEAELASLAESLKTLADSAKHGQWRVPDEQLQQDLMCFASLLTLAPGNIAGVEAVVANCILPKTIQLMESLSELKHSTTRIEEMLTVYHDIRRRAEELENLRERQKEISGELDYLNSEREERQALLDEAEAAQRRVPVAEKPNKRWWQQIFEPAPRQQDETTVEPPALGGGEEGTIDDGQWEGGWMYEDGTPVDGVPVDYPTDPEIGHPPGGGPSVPPDEPIVPGPDPGLPPDPFIPGPIVTS